MSLSATLQLGDNTIGLYNKEYLITECRYHFARSHNFYAPDTDARCDKISITVVAPGKEDLSLHEWYINQTVVSGRIVFDLSDQAVNEVSPCKILQFEDAECFSISESYQIDHAFRRLLKLEFIARQIITDNVVFDTF